MGVENTDTIKTAVVHVAQVVGANATAWGLAITEINGLLTSISLVLATSFTIYKFIKEWNKK